MVINGQAFRMRLRLTDIKLDPNKWSKAVDEAIQRLVKKAAVEWLKAVIKKIPVYSGFAKGSIANAEGFNGNLSRYLREAVSISPVKNAPKWYYHPGRSGRIRKTAENAGQFAHYTFTSGQHKFGFFFRSDVVHLIINNFFKSVSPTSDWQALEAGRKAFSHYIRENIRGKIPKIKHFLIKSQSSLNPTETV